MANVVYKGRTTSGGSGSGTVATRYDNSYLTEMFLTEKIPQQGFDSTPIARGF